MAHSEGSPRCLWHNPGMKIANVTGLLAGVDEAGRGPLAGAVVAAAVILDPADPIAGLNDSKKLTEKRREVLFAEIVERALGYCIASASVEEIDHINILQASLLAMQRAIAGLPVQPAGVQVDGNRCPDIALPCEAIVRGDGKVAAISAASILAKVTRDRQMIALDREYPEYGFARHKGYPTRMHLDKLAQLGATPQHRRSFAPVQRSLRSRL